MVFRPWASPGCQPAERRAGGGFSQGATARRVRVPRGVGGGVPGVAAGKRLYVAYRRSLRSYARDDRERGHPGRKVTLPHSLGG